METFGAESLNKALEANEGLMEKNCNDRGLLKNFYKFLCGC